MRGDKQSEGSFRPPYFAVQRIERLHLRLGARGRQLGVTMALQIADNQLDAAARTFERMWIIKNRRDRLAGAWRMLREPNQVDSSIGVPSHSPGR